MPTNEYRDIDEVKREVASLPHIVRNITNIINIKELKKDLDRLNERELRRRQSR